MSDSGNQNTPENQALRGARYGGPLRVTEEVILRIGEFADRVYTGVSNDFAGLHQMIEEAARQSDLEIDPSNSEWGEELPDPGRAHTAFLISAQAYFLGIRKGNEYLNRWWEAEVLNIREKDRAVDSVSELDLKQSRQETSFAECEQNRRDIRRLSSVPCR